MGLSMERMRIVQREPAEAVLQAALRHGYTPLQASVIARRLPEACADDIQRYVRPEIRDLDSPDLLPDIEPAAVRIARAVICEEPLILCVDHDADGVTSLAVLYGALVDAMGVDPANVHCYSSHRLREGYGISDGVVDRIIGDGHSSGVLISADQGSGDEARVARLRVAGIETVVTDHHGIEGTGPASAVACVNPCREDSLFPDKFIAGCHVAWLVMAQVRRKLIECGHLPETTPKLGFLLPFVALGTCADCVSFARSRNNRLIVQRGLHLINTQPDPCWEALANVKSISGPITTESLGYLVAPIINAGGRLDDALPGFKLLRAPTLEEALQYAELLNQANESRKAIEREMRDTAQTEARRQVEAGGRGLCIWMPGGHSGVHGIVASRITEAYGRPTLCLSPKLGEPGIVTGSARSVPGFDVREAFAAIDAQAPGMLLKWGGHQGAGGLTLKEEDIERMRGLWDAAVAASDARIGPEVLTDGPLPSPPRLELLSELAALAPYGREFDAPVFDQEVWLTSCRRVGEGGKHLQLSLDVNGEVVKGIWFSVPDLDWDPVPGDLLRAVFTLDANTFRGTTTVQLIVRHAEPVHRKGAAS